MIRRVDPECVREDCEGEEECEPHPDEQYVDDCDKLQYMQQESERQRVCYVLMI